MVILVIWFAIALAFCWVFYCFDAVIKHQYFRHYDSWVASGSPAGMFFRPPGSASHFGNPYMMTYARQLRKEPDWASSDPEAKSLIKRYFQSQKIWVVCVLVSFFVVIFAT